MRGRLDGVTAAREEGSAVLIERQTELVVRLTPPHEVDTDELTKGGRARPTQKK